MENVVRRLGRGRELFSINVEETASYGRGSEGAGVLPSRCVTECVCYRVGVFADSVCLPIRCVADSVRCRFGVLMSRDR
jgi:hypothetical protein